MPGTEFSVNTNRFDPYKTFRFRIKWDGKYVAGVSKVSGLTRTTEVVKHREGGSPGIAYRSPGQTEYTAITLERGVTHDPEFENWASLVWNKTNATGTFDAAKGTEVSLKNFRKDIIIELYNEADQKVLAYNVYRCWVSEYTALPDLDSNSGNTVAIQKIKLENEGWTRDASVAEPTEYQAS
ncbi:MAG TPA: phage tail protein [Roseiflexaceae bacterium]